MYVPLFLGKPMYVYGIHSQLGRAGVSKINKVKERIVRKFMLYHVGHVIICLKHKNYKFLGYHQLFANI